MRFTATRKLMGAFVALSLVTAACGGDDDTTTAPPAAPEDPADDPTDDPATTTAPADDPEPSDIDTEATIRIAWFLAAASLDPHTERHIGDRPYLHPVWDRVLHQNTETKEPRG